MTDIQDVGVSQDYQNVLLSEGTNLSESSMATATSDTLGSDDDIIGMHEQLTIAKGWQGHCVY